MWKLAVQTCWKNYHGIDLAELNKSIKTWDGLAYLRNV